MKLAAVLACRNKSSRLYAKPLQNLNVKKEITVLDYLISQLKKVRQLDKIVLAVSKEKENLIYQDIAKKHGLPFISGDGKDVLKRLIKGAGLAGADNILRATTESPFPYLDNLGEVYKYHLENRIDFSTTKGLPDGSCYEIISTAALKKSWQKGKKRHRSELCSLYIFENKKEFKIKLHEAPKKLQRPEIRLTGDWPEDLIVLRRVYQGLGLSPGKTFSLEEIINYLDKNPGLKAINSWISAGQGRIW